MFLTVPFKIIPSFKSLMSLTSLFNSTILTSSLISLPGLTISFKISSKVASPTLNFLIISSLLTFLIFNSLISEESFFKSIEYLFNIYLATS